MAKKPARIVNHDRIKYDIVGSRIKNSGLQKALRTKKK